MAESKAAALTVLDIGYLAKCTVPNCTHVTIAILLYADRSSRPLSNLKRCNLHTREALHLSSAAFAFLEAGRETMCYEEGFPAG